MTFTQEDVEDAAHLMRDFGCRSESMRGMTMELMSIIEKQHQAIHINNAVFSKLHKLSKALDKDGRPIRN